MRRLVALQWAAVAAGCMWGGDLRVRAESSGDAPSAPMVHATDAEHRIGAALDEPLREPLKADAMPLRDIVQLLSEQHQTPIVIDAAALAAHGVSPDAQVDLKLSGVSLRSALEHALRSVREKELTYEIADESLVITTKMGAEKLFKTVVYRVDDLAIRQVEGDVDSCADYDALIDVIVTTVAYDSWQENGQGLACIVPFEPGMLVIMQTGRIHDQVARLLADLRRNKAAVAGQHLAEDDAANQRLVTRAISIVRDDLTAPENRPALREALIRSVDWLPANGEVDEADVFLSVFPKLIVVRHQQRVVQQVARVVDEINGRFRFPNQGGQTDEGGQ